MNIYERFLNLTDEGKNTLIGIQSIIENCKTIKNKVLTFLDTPTDNVRSSEMTNLLSVALTDKFTGRTFVTWISPKTYYDATNDEDGETVLEYTASGDEITVSNGDIVDAIENITQEATLQEEFLSYVLSTEAIAKSDFITNISAKYHAFSGVLIDKYAQLLSNDAVSALSNYLGLINSDSVVNSNDEFIEVVDNSAYYDGPNVFLTAVCQIFETVGSFFAAAFKHFNGIINFFRKLWSGVQQLGKFLIKKMFSQLTTIYEKGDVKYGIIDVPVIQFNIGKLTKVVVDGKVKYTVDRLPSSHADNVVSGLFTLLDTELGPGINPGWGKYGQKNYRNGDIHVVGGDTPQTHDFTVFQGSNASWPATLGDFASQMCCHNLVNVDSDGNEYLLPYDVVIPTNASGVLDSLFLSAIPTGSPNDLILRISATSELDITLSVFVATSYSDLETLNDKEIATRIVYSLPAAFYYLLSLYPILPVNVNSDLSNYTGSLEYARWMAIGAPIVTCTVDETNWNSEPDENFNLVKRLKLITTSFNTYVANISSYTYEYKFSIACFVSGLLMHGALMGPISDASIKLDSRFSYQGITWRPTIDEVIGTLFFMNNDSIISTVPAWVEVDNIDHVVDVSTLTANYRPYVKYALTGYSVHVQTYADQVAEAKRLIISSIIAIAATIITIKVLKFRKSRLQRQQLDQGNLDTYIFRMFDPNSSQQTSMAEYNKLWKKARRSNRINSLLGLNSSESVISNLDGTVSIINSIKSLANGSESNNNTSTIAEIKRLIKL